MSISFVPSYAVTLIDSTNNSGVTRGYFPPDTDKDTAFSQLAGFVGAVSAITGCSPVRISVTYRVKIDPTTPPVEPTEARQEGLFVLSNEDGTLFSVLAVPGIRSSKLIDDVTCFSGININQLDSEVAAFLTDITGGIYVDPFGIDLVAIEAAYMREVS